MRQENPVILGKVFNPDELWQKIGTVNLNRECFSKHITTIYNINNCDSRLRNFISRCLISWKKIIVEKSFGQSSRFSFVAPHQKIIISNVETIISLENRKFLVKPNVIISCFSTSWDIDNYRDIIRTTITGFRWDLIMKKTVRTRNFR